MNSRVFTIVAAATVGVASLASGSAAASAGALVASVSSHVWGTAFEVPGTAALNQGGYAQVSVVSCKALGTCSAGGTYLDSAHHQQIFVVSATNGFWGTAIQVPGSAALNQGGTITITSLSCASAGNCSAGGYYMDGSGHQQVFVASETLGTWGKAIEVPGMAALNQDGQANLTSVSCGSAGNCSAGGWYVDSSIHAQAFVVSQKNGFWGMAKEVPGTAALNQGGSAVVNSVSCASAGNCSAGGDYTDFGGLAHAFAASQTNGTWGKAKKVPGAIFTQGSFSGITAVSCALAGNCSAVGWYTGNASPQQMFAASQANSTWGKAIEVPGTAALNQGQSAIPSISCASAGNCSAGGYYTDTSGNQQAFVFSQANGTWRTAKEVPGTAALNQGGSAAVNSVSCAAPGNCAAGGYYLASPANGQAFVVSQANGTWRTAIEVPGIAALNQGGSAAVNSLSCAAVGNCSAGGSYADSSGNQQAFVVNES